MGKGQFLFEESSDDADALTISDGFSIIQSGFICRLLAWSGVD